MNKTEQFLREMAQDDWDCGHTFDPDDFCEFRKICKECGFKVNENDFEQYFDYVAECRYQSNNFEEF